MATCLSQSLNLVLVEKEIICKKSSGHQLSMVGYEKKGKLNRLFLDLLKLHPVDYCYEHL